MKRGKLVAWGFWLVVAAYLLMIISFFAQGNYSFAGISFMIAGFLGVATLIMGIVSAVKIKRKKFLGKGFATATIILSVILIIYFLYTFYGIVF